MKLYSEFIQGQGEDPNVRMSRTFEPPKRRAYDGFKDVETTVVGTIVGLELGTRGYWVTWAVPDDWQPPWNE